MKKPSLLILPILALFAINLSATCVNEGLHTGGGAVVSAVGGVAILPQNGIPAGCYLYITHIKALLMQTGANAGDTKLAIWLNGTCTGTIYYELTSMGVSAVNHNSMPWEFTADQNGGFRTGPSTAVCVGFESGSSGLVESIMWTGMFSGNVL